MVKHLDIMSYTCKVFSSHKISCKSPQTPFNPQFISFSIHQDQQKYVAINILYNYTPSHGPLSLIQDGRL